MRDTFAVRIVLIAAFASLFLAPLAQAQEFRVETRPLESGADLLTVFGRSADGEPEVPVMSLLKDTLGDSNPSNDRLRYLWVLPNSRRSVGQRIAAFVPFFYRRLPFSHAPKPVDPKPLIDFSAARGP